MNHAHYCSAIGSIPSYCDCGLEFMDKNTQLTERQRTLTTLDRIFKVEDVVYLSGPMTGIDQFNRPAFTRAKKMIASVGATVLSPADIKQGPPWEHQMRQCIRYIADCTKIVMLPGWENSKGALIEHLVACQILVPRWYLEDSFMRASQTPMFTMSLSNMTRFMGERLAHNSAEDDNG